MEAALLATLWPNRGFSGSEKPRLMTLLASPQYQGLLQASLLTIFWVLHSSCKGFCGIPVADLHVQDDIRRSCCRSTPQATGGDQQMLDMLVEATATTAAADRWRWKNADAALCVAVVEDQVRAGRARFGGCCSKVFLARQVMTWMQHRRNTNTTQYLRPLGGAIMNQRVR